MATTTHITNIAHLLDLDAYAGEFIDDYDMDAVRRDYTDRLDEHLPAGMRLASNGDIYAELDSADEAREFNFAAFIGNHDPADLFEKHDKTAELLLNVEDATRTLELAKRAQVTAVRAAKDSGRYTVGQIARAAGVTRDGIYKMLTRGEA